MNVCLVGWSALECWRRIRALGKDFLAETMELATTTPYSGLKLSLSEKEAQELADQYGLSWPIQVAVDDSLRSRSRKYVTTKKASPADFKGSFVELAPGLYVLTPEYLFRWMSSELDVIDLVRLGNELCSLYAINHYRFDDLVDSLAITTVDRLLQCARLEGGHGNRRKMRCALRYVRERTASPKESEMSMKFGLPHNYGGFNLWDHELNSTILLSEHAQKLAGKEFCRGDMYFEDGDVDVEYDSDEWHSDSDKRREDERRRKALEYDGHTVIPVGNSELKDAESLSLVAKTVCKEKGKRFRPQVPNYTSRQNALFKRFKDNPQFLRSCPAVCGQEQ